MFAAILLLLFGASIFAQQDPPSRVARLNYLNGNVSMEPAGVDDWAPADLNRPFTIGDYLYADEGAEAELHLDVAVIRIGSQTSFGFLNLDDRTVQLKLTEGDMYIRVHDFGTDQVFEVDTPNAAVTLPRDGAYRFRVDSNGNMSYVVVRQGQAEITGGGQAFTLNADNSALLTGADQLSYSIELAPPPDEFDQWCQERDAHEAELAARRRLPPTVIGSDDLDDYGSWQNTGQYGAVWYPQNVDPGWAPYHYGHWAWIEPWGWSWIDSMPWGFAPFHYGRWAYIGSRWGWCPGPIAIGVGPVIRPYYAPAMVAWFGGAHWGVGISIGGGPSLGWVPLGWGELYTPAYRCSPRYFNNVNVYNTRIVRNVNITNVYNNVYVNKQVYNQSFVNARAPNAVMSMPQSAFASGRSVRQAAVPVRQADFARLQTASVISPPVAPTRQAILPAAAGRPVGRPAPQVLQRQVVAKSTPPPAPAAFAARQPYLQQHAGQPVNQQELRQATPAARPVPANVRPASASASPVPVKPGASVGNAASFYRPAAPVSHGTPPHLRQGNTPAGNGRAAGPAGSYSGPVPANRPPSQPQAQEQSRPVPQSTPPPPRQQAPQTQQRSQPAQERSQPVQERRPYPARSAQTQPPRPEGRPAPQAHEERPRNDKNQR